MNVFIANTYQKEVEIKKKKKNALKFHTNNNVKKLNKRIEESRSSYRRKVNNTNPSTFIL